MGRSQLFTRLKHWFLHSGTQRVTRVVSGVVILVSCIALLGWALEIPALKTMLIGGGDLRANAALGLLLSGISLGLLTRKRLSSRTTRLIQACTVLAGAIGLLTLLQFVSGWNFGIDELLFRDPSPYPPMLPPGRMGLLAAVNLSLISVALWLSSWEASSPNRASQLQPTHPWTRTWTRIWIAQNLAAVVAVIALQSAIARTYGLPLFSLFDSYVSGMGTHTAFAFGLLSIGVLALRSDRGWMRTVTSAEIGGIVVRRFLPMAIVLPLVLGWLVLQGVQANWYATGYGIAVMAIALVVSSVVLLVRSGSRLNRLDHDRQQSELDRAVDQEIIQQQLAEIEAIYHTAPIGLAILDRDLRFIRINQRLAEINGLSIEAHLDRTVGEVLPQIASEVEPLFHRLLETGEPVLGLELTGETVAQPGVQRTWIENWYPLRDAAGQMIGINIVVQEITQRKQSELALREASQRIKTIWESMSDAYTTLDREWRIVYANQTALRVIRDLSGLEPEEILGKSHWEVFAWTVGQPLEQEYRRAMAEQVPVHLEVLYEPTGNWFEINAYPSSEGLGLYYRDISDRKRSELDEEFLRSLDQHLRSLTDADEMAQAVVDRVGQYLKVDYCHWQDIDVAGDLVTARTEWRRLPDSPSGLGTRRLSEFTLPGLAKLYCQGQPAIACDVATYPHTADFVETYQSHNVFAFVGVPYILGGNWVALLTVTFPTVRTWETREVTLLQNIVARFWSLVEQTRSIQALKQSEDRFRTLANNISQFAWITDASGWINWYNQRWFDYTGTTLEEMQGWGWQAVHHPDHVDRVVAHIRYCFETGEVWEDTFPLRSREGQYRWFLSRAIPIRDEQGQILRWFGTNTDITDRVGLEEMLAAQTEELVRTNRLKDEFLAALSHELRTPLNPILGWTQMMKTQRLSPAKTAEALDVIERNIKQQITLVNDLLDVSRVIQGKLNLTLQPVNLVTVVQRALATVQFTAQAKQIQIQIQAETALPVLGDGDRLQQVFWNLLTNAIKFTPEGGRIAVHLSRVTNGNSVDYAQAQVTDNGIGIEADFLPYVFEHFRQADGSDTRRYGGLGLGLAIVRHLVELHGGTVAVESAGTGQGSTFTVRLPLHIVSAANLIETAQREEREIAVEPPSRLLQNPLLAVEVPPIAVADSALSGLRILLVDDDQENLDLLCFLLQEHGAIVIAFTSAIDALVSISTDLPDAIADVIIDVIISDIGMPQMSGYDFIQQVRTLPAGRQIPALALTAFGQQKDQATALQSGFNAYITKPVDPLELLSTLIQLVQAKTVS